MTTTPNITAEERAALLEVRRQLAEGELKYNPDPSNMMPFAFCDPYLGDCSQRAMVFNMCIAISQADCGTVMCVGGHAARIMGYTDVREIGTFVDDKRFESLFYPHEGPRTYKSYTPQEAVVAIDRFLAGDEKPWRRDE